MNGELATHERRALRQKARVATLQALRELGGEATRADVRDQALGDGGFTTRERMVPPPERGAQHESLIACELSWALTNLKREGLVENPHRGVWRLAPAALEPDPPATARTVAPDRAAMLRTMPYRDYLRTPEWRRTRAAALLRAGDRCSLDVTHSEGLEVHHRTYEHRGEERVSDLVVLCAACHALHHRANGRPGLRPHIAPPELAAQAHAAQVDHDLQAVAAALAPTAAAELPSLWRRLAARRQSRTPSRRTSRRAVGGELAS